MPRPKAESPKASETKSKTESVKTTGAARAQLFTLRVRPEWKDWLARFADFHRSDASDLVDAALAEFAKARGFEAPPKR